jgi:hypothetical protein
MHPPNVFPVDFFAQDTPIYTQYCVPAVYHLFDPVFGTQIDVYAGKAKRAADRVWYELFSWNQSEIWFKFYRQDQKREWLEFISRWMVWIHPLLDEAQVIDDRETSMIQTLEPIANFGKCKAGRLPFIKEKLEAYKRLRCTEFPA